jgi:hypothetical protein
VPGGLIIGWWWVESELDAQQCELVAFEVVDRDPAPALSSSDHRGEGQLERGLLVAKAGMTLVRRRSSSKLRSARLAVLTRMR